MTAPLTDAHRLANAKVYCQQCHYLIRQLRGSLVGHDRCVVNVCSHPHAVVRFDTPLGAVSKRRRPEQRNAHNDCRDFQPGHWWSPLARDGACRLAVGLVVGAFGVLVWILEYPDHFLGVMRPLGLW